MEPEDTDLSEEKSQYEADIDRLRAGINPLLTEGLHPAALMYVGGMMLIAAAKGSGWSREQVVTHLGTMYDGVKMAMPCHIAPADAAVH